MLNKSTRGRRSDLFLSDFIKLLLLFLNSVGDIYRPAIAFSVSLKIVPRHSFAPQWEGERKISSGGQVGGRDFQLLLFLFLYSCCALININYLKRE